MGVAAHAERALPAATMQSVDAGLKLALDWPTFSSCLADDVTLLNPDVPGATSLHRLDGREVVERSFRGVFDAALASTPPQGPDIRPEHLTVRKDGSLAVATFEFARGAGAFGRRSIVLVRHAGRWRITHVHASNVSAPPAARPISEASSGAPPDRRY